ncbi:benzoate/H(+) symporter BenE family transporter [Microtetraspora sp. NBRC 16547]|uniref:benzoate/H(+) symporter BenE family transporter n=1 Tax=Microtetraspora sp. NBRC 16547 TaxID=3030993 RepID=UPI0024A3A987|nr:benzoate/H(+) symporter BenE family transporter [Microtetraspora sp. NBRC 16547]GLW97941.1 benzoate transporter [Microtetraspora sp. NBRC 16547]
MGRVLQPILAGVVLAIVGFASSFAVVLAGLRAVGADQAQAASGLLVLCLAMGALGIGLGLRYRMPMSVAWSTPGAALLVSVGADGADHSADHGADYRAALGAFAVTGLLFVLAGLSDRFSRLLHAIPAPLAGAMLAGVLLPLCLAPVQAVVRFPGPAIPIVVAWAVLFRFARRWAVPGALLVTVAVILLTQPRAEHGAGLWPVMTVETPTFSVGALVGIAIPLFIVTMASQNVAGMSMLATYGYHPSLRPILTTTGLATMAVAPFGGHAVNLAAITTALAAGPDAHPDRDRRWIASVTGGVVYIVLGLSIGLTVSLIASSPPLLIETVAGLALLATLGSAIQAAVADEGQRDAAVVTFVVTASGIAPFGIGAAFWGLAAGLAFRALSGRLRGGAKAAAPAPSSPDAAGSGEGPDASENGRPAGRTVTVADR